MIDTRVAPQLHDRPATGAPSSAARRRHLAGALATACAAALPTLSFAQSGSTGDWPNRPVRMIVNFPPGSSPDVVARAVAAPLGQALGQSVVVENRTGAGGAIGAEAVAKAAPDGYTLLMSAGSSLVMVPHLTPMSFDVFKDLAPVAAIARIEVLLVTRNDQPFKTYQEFVQHAKANPGKLSYSSAGNGTSLHIAGELVKSMAGIYAVHVPYRGSTPAIQDLMAGQVDFSLDSGSAVPHIRSGRLRLLATGSEKRSPLFPDTPTLRELGLKDFDAGTTHALMAPSGTPPAIIERLNREVNRVLEQPQVAQQIRSISAVPTPMSPAELRTLMERDSQRYGAIIRKQKIQAD